MSSVKKHPIISFVALSFLIGLGIVIPLILSMNGIISLQLPEYLFMLAASSSSIAALIVVSIAYGKKGILKLLKRFT